MALMVDGMSSIDFIKSMTQHKLSHATLDALSAAGVVMAPNFYGMEATLPGGSKLKTTFPISSKKMSEFATAGMALPSTAEVAEKMFRTFVFQVAVAVLSHQQIHQLIGVSDKVTGWDEAMVMSLFIGMEQVKTLPTVTKVQQAVMPASETTPAPAAPSNSGAPGVLMYATAVGQKVLGTSGGSLYTVVGVTSKVKIASKYEGNTMSFRIEGSPISAQQRQHFKSMGFKDSKAYLSMHLYDVPTHLVTRTLGSVLYGTELSFSDMAKSAAILI